jgi:3-mercaptopyruvate sulfurtransferase SseA
VALQLRKFGIRNVRPLLGGFHEWKKLGFPLVDIPETGLPLDNPPFAAERPA